MQLKENRRFWQRASVFTFLLAGIAALVAWVSVAQSAGIAGVTLYFPIIQRHIPPTPTPTPTPSPTPTPVPGYISGGVSYNGASVAGIKVDLVRYQTGVSGSYTTIQTEITDSSGNYVFRNVPALASGYAYYARFLNSQNGNNGGYLSYWKSIDITSYNGASIAQFPGFDILDISLVSPDDGSSWTDIHQVFRWTRRPFTNDNYSVMLLSTSEAFSSNLLGYVDNVTLLHPSSMPNGAYDWFVKTTIDGVGYGYSRASRVITVAIPAGIAAPTGAESADGLLNAADLSVEQLDALLSR